MAGGILTVSWPVLFLVGFCAVAMPIILLKLLDLSLWPRFGWGLLLGWSISYVVAQRFVRAARRRALAALLKMALQWRGVEL